MAEEDVQASAQVSSAGIVIGPGALDPRTAAYLDEQTRLARLQSDNLIEQNAFELSHLRFRRYSDFAKFALELAVFLVVLLAVCGLASMVWNASRERGLVVDAFSVPADLAQTGMTGSVVANRLIDELGALQASSFAVTQGGETYRRAESGGVRVEIPDTGISLDELQRYLREWLGHETHASGEVVHTPKGWSLTVRYGDAPGVTLAGSDLDALIGQGAEKLMAQALPYRYVEHLSRKGRFADALALLPALAAHGSGVERGRAYAAWASVSFYQGDMRRAVEKAQQALDADPESPGPYGWVAAASANLGHEEAAWSAAAGVPVHMHGEEAAVLDPAVSSVMPYLFTAYRAEDAGDYGLALAEWTKLSTMETSAYDPSSHAGDVAATHDLARAQRIAARIPTNTRNGKLNFGLPLTQMILAYDAGDWAGAVRAGAEADAILKDRPGLHWQQVIFTWPIWADAMVRSGDVAGGEALIAKTPLDCDDCVRKRGRIAAFRHDWAGAARWFALVSARSPHVPLADTDWGQMLMAKGDRDGAIAKFESAHRKGPHFADPLEMWGEALMAKNRSDLALAKFEEAAKYAPNWKRLHRKWGEALSYVGRKDEAAKQFALARSLDG